MSPLSAKQILASASLLFKAGLPKFIWPVLPFLLLSEAIGLAFENPAPGGFFFLITASFLVGTVSGAIAMAALLRLQFPGASIVLSVSSVLRLLLVEIYLGLITGLALLLLVLPALWVMSATFVAPIYAFCYPKGPVASVSSSVDITKGNLWPILFSGLAYMVVFFLGSYLASFLPQPLQFIASLLVSVAALYLYALMVVVFAHLHPNPSFQGTADEHSSPVPSGGP